MKLFCLIGIAAAAAMLSDCGGSQSQLAQPAPFQQSGAQPRLGQLSARLAYVDKSRRRADRRGGDAPGPQSVMDGSRRDDERSALHLQLLYR